MTDSESLDPDDHVQEIEQSSVSRDDPDFTSAIQGIAALERRIASAGRDTTHDALLELRDCVLVILQRAAALRERIDDVFVQAIEAHGPITSGSIRYIVSLDRSTKCMDKRAATEHVLEAVGGDISRFCDQLVAQPFKPSSCKAVIPGEVYWRCFERVEKKTIEGLPIEKLAKIDTRFVIPAREEKRCPPDE